VQSTGGNRTHHRTPESRLLYATKLSFGEKGLKNNALMEATAWILKKLMEKLKEKILQTISRLFFLKNFYYITA